jgi:hypothetical protein
MIRLEGPINQSLLPAAALVFFVFPYSAHKLASCENKKSLALRAQGLVEVGGGFEPP